MTKRSKWLPKATILSATWEKVISESYPPWPYETEQSTVPWLEGIHDADTNFENTLKLVNLLRSDLKLTKQARLHFADLLERRMFARRNGRPRTPSYSSTPRDAFLSAAMIEVRDLVNARTNPKTVSAAVEEVAKAQGIPVETLENAYKGKSASTRRIQKRRHT